MDNKRVDPNPLRTTLKELGFVHVYTWDDSYGTCSHEIYQDARPFTKRLFTLVISRGSLAGFREENNPQIFKDYLKAKDIKENKEERYEPINASYYSPCGTASSRKWKDTLTDDIYHLESVAGHGSWAILESRPISPRNLKQE